MKNLKVKTKLLTGFLIVTALTIVVGTVAVVNLSRIDTSYSNVIETNGKPLQDAGIAIGAIHSIRAEMRLGAMYSGNPEKVEQQAALVKENCDKFERHAEAFGDSLILDETKTLFKDAMDTFRNRCIPVLNQAFEYLRSGMPQDEVMAYLLENLTPAVNSTSSDFEKCMAIKSDYLETTSADCTSLSNEINVILLVVTAISAIISVVLALYISGIISKPLALITEFMTKAGSTGDLTLSQEDMECISELSQAKDDIAQLSNSAASFVMHVTKISNELDSVAHGDLTTDIDLLSDSDVMGKSLQHMIMKLSDMFSEINDVSTQVALGTRQIADGAQTLAQGSTEQTASIQQLSNSITEIAMKTKNNSEMASRATELASHIMHNAEKGSTHMSEMLTAVKDIKTASVNIKKVIKVIDDIAFQTNILALNATMEAARAGQHGKGFGVVAEEVRNLAAKSAEAAKNTELLISNSIEKAELGTRIATETSESLSEIVNGINENNRLVSEIAQSSVEQSASINEINTGIEQVAQVVQQNSATAEESAAATEEISVQSEMLENLIAQFKLRDSLYVDYTPDELDFVSNKHFALTGKTR